MKNRDIQLSFIVLFAILFAVLFAVLLKFIKHCNLIEGYETPPYLERIDARVEMPINDTFDCVNKCNPNNTCYISGEQCISDKDCYGCSGVNKIDNRNYQPYMSNSSLVSKLQYSAPYNKNENYVDDNPPTYFKGVDLWTFQFEKGQELYDKRYKPTNKWVSYPQRKTMSGEFINEDPLQI
jgi:hypothetical protein